MSRFIMLMFVMLKFSIIALIRSKIVVVIAVPFSTLADTGMVANSVMQTAPERHVNYDGNVCEMYQ